jgi:hypothetical protein
LHTIPSAPHTRHWHGGPPPEYQPKFTDKELAQARAVAGQLRARHGLVQRARLAILFGEHPIISSPAAARRLGQSVSWVRKWRRRWATHGFSLKDGSRPGRRSPFPDCVRALVIGIACELPCQRGLHLGRHFASSVWQAVTLEGIAISLRTVQRILAKDHLKPWRYVSWMHPREPHFVEKARVILDLYQGIWEGKPIGPQDQVLCGDEKPSIQARARAVVPPGRGRPGRVESDYQRRGALQYLCIWNVLRGIPWGRCEPKNGIAPFARLVEQVMSQEPYRSAPRVFLIVDNGSSHRGTKAAQRLRSLFPNLILVHTPTHASWLSQVEIYFSIVQRKVLTPAAAEHLCELAARILGFEEDCRRCPNPFKWKFTRTEFDRRLQELAA